MFIKFDTQKYTARRYLYNKQKILNEKTKLTNLFDQWCSFWARYSA